MIAVGTWFESSPVRLPFYLCRRHDAYGVWVCYLMLRRPEDLAVEENHVSGAYAE
jgi:hypothetical protein